MSKKNRNQRRKKNKSKSSGSAGAGNSRTSSKLAAEEIEEKALRAEAAGDYERARNGYARLYREDAEKYGDHYRRLSREAFRELLRGGLLQKAEGILKQTIPLLSAEELPEWQMRLAAERQEWESALTIALSLLTSADPVQRRLAGDVMVAAGAVPDQVTLPDEALSARRAMELFCEGKSAEALQAARAIPRTSVFAPWSLFLKGAEAVYQGNFGNAVEAFRRIPEDCAAATIAETLLAFKTQAQRPGLPAPTPTPDQFALLLDLCGEAKLACVLPDCLRALHAKGMAAAYDCVRDKYPGFVSLDAGAGAAMVSYFLGAAVYHKDPDQDRLISRISSRKNASPMDAVVAAILHYRGSERGVVYADDPWRQFLKAGGKVLGQWPHWNLVKALIGVDQADYLEKTYGKYRDDEDREEILELMREAVEVAPESETVALRYLELLEEFRATSERNRFLDTAAGRFPDNASILKMAADRSVERDALHKALKYYERAIERDPTNVSIRDGLVVCALNMARRSVVKGKVAQGEQLMDLAQHHAPKGGKTITSEGFVMARRSLIAEFYGMDPAKAAEWKRQASQKVPVDALEFFMVAAAAFYCVDPYLPTKKELINRMDTARAGIPAATDSIRLMLEVMSGVKVTGLSAALKGKMLRRLREAFSPTFASYVRKASDAARQIPDIMAALIDIDQTMAAKLLPAWLRARRDEEGAIAADLVEAFARITGPLRSPENFPPSSSLKKLEDRAAACAAPQLVQLARELFNRASHQEARRAEYDELEFFEDDDEDDGNGNGNGDAELPPIDFMIGMIESILAASPAERENMRKQVGMPKRDWDQLVRQLEKTDQYGRSIVETLKRMNPYSILGCTMQSSDEDIRQAYLNRVRQFPPDSASMEFQLIQEAYERISSAEGRAREVTRVEPGRGTLTDGLNDYCRVSSVMMRPFEIQNLRRGIIRSL